jgi:hypothetical protein
LRKLALALAGVAGLAALAPLPAGAQQLTATEFSIGASVAVARHTFAGVDLGLGRRTGTTTRVSLSLAAGSLERQPAGRAQLTLQFLVNPFTRTGLGLYGGLGAAVTARRASSSAGYVALLLGIEATPGAASGWFVEAGFGGGARAAIGWRSRRFPRWWRAG